MPFRYTRQLIPRYPHFGWEAFKEKSNAIEGNASFQAVRQLYYAAGKRYTGAAALDLLPGSISVFTLTR